MANPSPEPAVTFRKPGVLWWLLAVAATAVGGYGVALQDARPVGGAVPGMPWLDVVHFVGGGIALIVGVWGFRRDLLARQRALHRWLGRVYMVAVSVGGLAALAMAVYSLGGLTGHLGFGLLAVAWLVTTGCGWLAIRGKNVAAHRRWMVRSYALCCAAIALRIQLPLMIAVTGSFQVGYPIVSWSSWVPNLLFAEWWLRRHRNP